jgi:hypothetical protein
MVRISAWRRESSVVFGRPWCWTAAPCGPGHAGTGTGDLDLEPGPRPSDPSAADPWRLAGETDWIGLDPAPDAFSIPLCPPAPLDYAVPEGDAPRPGSQSGQPAQTGTERKAERAPKRDPTDRAAETLFRVLYQHHEQLSVMADTKAHIMITLCAALAGIATTQLTDPLLRHTAVTVILACLLAAGFAVVATAPRLPTVPTTGPRDEAFNPLFFSHFCRLRPDDFTQEIERILGDRRLVHRAMTRDLHGLGSVLGRKKYRYLRWCYWTFLGGFAAAVAVLAITTSGRWP